MYVCVCACVRACGWVSVCVRVLGAINTNCLCLEDLTQNCQTQTTSPNVCEWLHVLGRFDANCQTQTTSPSTVNLAPQPQPSKLIQSPLLWPCCALSGVQAYFGQCVSGVQRTARHFEYRLKLCRYQLCISCQATDIEDTDRVPISNNISILF